MSSELGCQFSGDRYHYRYGFGEVIMEIKCCEGWWVGHPAQSRHLVFLESKDIILFNILNVLLSKCYLILQNSLKLFGHSSSRITSENWDPVQEVVFTNMASSSAESPESHKHGVCSVWVCHFWLCMPMLICSTEAKRWGRAPVCPAGTSWPPEGSGHL